MCKKCANIAGVGEITNEFMLGVAVGGFGGGIVTSVLEKIPVIKDNDMFVDLAKGVAGYYMLQQENDMIQGVGASLLGQAVAGLVGEFSLFNTTTSNGGTVTERLVSPGSRQRAVSLAPRVPSRRIAA